MPKMRPVPRETLPSFLSRLAASMGVETPEFAYDLGGAFKWFLRGDPEVVNGLANWAGLREQEVKEMLSWTGMPIGKVRLQFRGEPVGSRALRNPVVEGCPTCLREDAQGNLSDPLTRMLFDAKGYAHLLASIPRLVTTKAMCAILGATTVELDALKKAGVLSPRTALAGARRKWLPDDGLSFLEELRTCAADASTPVDGRDWIAIQSAQARTGVRVADIINGIRSGEIEVQHFQPSAGYHGYQVSAAAISSYGDRIEARESLSGELSLAEFGRSVGIRDMERLMALIHAGEIPARLVIHPTTRRPQWRVTKSAVDTFRRHFLTPSMVHTEFGLSVNAARAILRAGRIAPDESKGRKFGDLYLRDDVLPLISGDSP